MASLALVMRPRMAGRLSSPTTRRVTGPASAGWR